MMGGGEPEEGNNNSSELSLPLTEED
jgi:hypothetical protein